MARPSWALPWRRLGLAKLAGRKGDAEGASKRSRSAADAIASLRRATALAPHDVFAWLDLGNALKDKGDVRGALAAYKEVQARHPAMSAIRRLQQWMLAAESHSQLSG